MLSRVTLCQFRKLRVTLKPCAHVPRGYILRKRIFFFSEYGFLPCVASVLVTILVCVWTVKYVSKTLRVGADFFFNAEKEISVFEGNAWTAPPVDGYACKIEKENKKVGRWCTWLHLMKEIDSFSTPRQKHSYCCCCASK